MRKLYRALIIILALCVFVSGSGIFAYAAGVIGEVTLEPITTMTELRARAATNTYFEQRYAYLTGNADDIAIVNRDMFADEASHLETLVNANISVLGYSITIDELRCWDNFAKVYITETVSFSVNDTVVEEEISHYVIIRLDEAGTPIVECDEYYEQTSDFASCSYIPPEALAELNASGDGSGECIIHVAANEVGTAEDASGWTKYGQEYDDLVENIGAAYSDWCASFLIWCSRRSNTPIPYYARSIYIKNEFEASGLYYSRTSSATTPQRGDIIFLYDNTHVGIIINVTSLLVEYIDGNNEGVVCRTSVNRDNSSFSGFARPAYGTSTHIASGNHSSNSQYHWRLCANCSYQATANEAHTYSSWHSNSVTHWKVCTICNYISDNTTHSLTWASTVSGHWRKCPICSYAETTSSHTYVQENNATHHWEECISCNRQRSYGLHSFVEDSPECYICRTCDYIYYGILPKNIEGETVYT